MSTTTLRLPEAVRGRIDRLAAAAGKSAHALMVETLEEATAAMERRLAFEIEAAERLAAYRRTGEHHTLDDVRTHLLARARGEDPPPPAALRDPSAIGDRARQ
jgi:predicted transcriptional regulator